MVTISNRTDMMIVDDRDDDAEEEEETIMLESVQYSHPRPFLLPLLLLGNMVDDDDGRPVDGIMVGPAVGLGVD
jgi:hypothetical protein